MSTETSLLELFDIELYYSGIRAGRLLQVLRDPELHASRSRGWGILVGYRRLQSRCQPFYVPVSIISNLYSGYPSSTEDLTIIFANISFSWVLPQNRRHETDRFWEKARIKPLVPQGAAKVKKQSQGSGKFFYAEKLKRTEYLWSSALPSAATISFGSDEQETALCIC